MRYFTSDWHINDPRISSGDKNLLLRYFDSTTEMNHHILDTIRNQFTLNPPTHLYHIGDVMYDDRGAWVIETLRKEYPDCIFMLVAGNYDEDKLDILEDLFDDHIMHSHYVDIGDDLVFMNHYPTTCKRMMKNDPKIDYCITGHIHGHWRAQHRMINVGVDAWSYRAVSEDDIKFYWNAMKNHYDENVFPYANNI